MARNNIVTAASLMALLMLGTAAIAPAHAQSDQGLDEMAIKEGINNAIEAIGRQSGGGTNSGLTGGKSGSSSTTAPGTATPSAPSSPVTTQPTPKPTIGAQSYLLKLPRITGLNAAEFRAAGPTGVDTTTSPNLGACGSARAPFQLIPAVSNIYPARCASSGEGSGATSCGPSSSWNFTHSFLNDVAISSCKITAVGKGKYPDFSDSANDIDTAIAWQSGQTVTRTIPTNMNFTSNRFKVWPGQSTFSRSQNNFAYAISDDAQVAVGTIGASNLSTRYRRQPIFWKPFAVINPDSDHYAWPPSAMDFGYILNNLVMDFSAARPNCPSGSESTNNVCKIYANGFDTIANYTIGTGMKLDGENAVPLAMEWTQDFSGSAVPVPREFTNAAATPLRVASALSGMTLNSRVYVAASQSIGDSQWATRAARVEVPFIAGMPRGEASARPISLIPDLGKAYTSALGISKDGRLLVGYGADGIDSDPQSSGFRRGSQALVWDASDSTPDATHAVLIEPPTGSTLSMAFAVVENPISRNRFFVIGDAFSVSPYQPLQVMGVVSFCQITNHNLSCSRFQSIVDFANNEGVHLPANVGNILTAHGAAVDGNNVVIAGTALVTSPNVVPQGYVLWLDMGML